MFRSFRSPVSYCIDSIEYGGVRFIKQVEGTARQPNLNCIYNLFFPFPWSTTSLEHAHDKAVLSATCKSVGGDNSSCCAHFAGNGIQHYFFSDLMLFKHQHASLYKSPNQRMNWNTQPGAFFLPLPHRLQEQPSLSCRTTDNFLSCRTTPFTSPTQ